MGCYIGIVPNFLFRLLDQREYIGGIPFVCVVVVCCCSQSCVAAIEIKKPRNIFGAVPDVKFNPLLFLRDLNFTPLLFLRPQEEEFHNLILSLDSRGKREGELRQALQERFDIAELERSIKDRWALGIGSI